jgi:hypothetical protein
MEPEGSLLHPQARTILPYPEPDKSGLFLLITLTEDPFQYYPPIWAEDLTEHKIECGGQTCL